LKNNSVKLKDDWQRVCSVWNKVKNNHWNPYLVIFEEIYDMRKIDRGIDYPLRRLLNSKEYGNKIRTYGCPSSMFGRHPFRWDNKVWLLIQVKVDETKNDQKT